MFDRVFRVYVVGQMCPIELFWIEKTFILERYGSADKNSQCPLWLIFETAQILFQQHPEAKVQIVVVLFSFQAALHQLQV